MSEAGTAGLPPELLALAAHDLKNELGALEATLQRLAADHPALPALQRSHGQCRALRQRFVMLLTLYGAQGRLAAWSEDDAPAELLLALQARHAAADDDGGPRVELDPQAEPPPFAHYDARLVSLALEAAVHNARRFARRQVLLGARSCEGGLTWWVADDGPGLGAAEGPGREAAQPTGLGTELCRAVAAAHRHGGRSGWVRLGNRPQGGALFELWLP